MLNKTLPEELTPLNIKAYFSNTLGACGCSELDTMIESILRFLHWCENYPTNIKAMGYFELYSEIGVFYIIAGLLDGLCLIQHGTSIRYPFLTEDGKRFLNALETYSAEEIDNANGEAYDGLYYGDF